MKVIIVTGTPGTGKTTFAKKLSKEKNYDYFDVNRIIKKYNLSEGYDKRMKTHLVDVKKLNKILIRIIIKSKKGLVIDSHLSHYLPKRYVELCYVIKCNIKKLKRRLIKRGYSKSKLRENLDAEIFDVCLTEAKERGHKIRIVTT